MFFVSFNNSPWKWCKVFITTVYNKNIITCTCMSWGGPNKKKTWKACCYNESTVYLLLFCFQVKLLFLPGPREDLLQPERENKWEGYCTLVVLVWSDAKLYYVVIWDNIIFCSTCTVLLKRTLIIVFVTDCSDILCF